MSRRESTPAPQPPATPTPEPKKKPAAHESKIFRPSSFASRKAEAEADNAIRAERRLVSLGPSDYRQKNLRTGKDEYIEVELFTDLDHPIDRWIKFPGPNGGLVPLQDHVGNNDKVVRHPLKRPLGRPQVSAHNETQLDGPQPRKG